MLQLQQACGSRPNRDDQISKAGQTKGCRFQGRPVTQPEVPRLAKVNMVSAGQWPSWKFTSPASNAVTFDQLELLGRSRATASPCTPCSPKSPRLCSLGKLCKQGAIAMSRSSWACSLSDVTWSGSCCNPLKCDSLRSRVSSCVSLMSVSLTITGSREAQLRDRDLN